jgi:enoyl-CoA hydratase/carnithine racemase
MDELTTTWEGDVAIVAWTDGENRFRPDSVAAHHALLDQLERRDGPLAVVMTGDGKYFSNGLDLDWMGANPEMAGDVVSEVHRLFRRLLALDAVVVAAVNGHAFAAGAMLTAACDLRVMRGDRGWWCLPEADLGLPLTEPMAAVVQTGLPRPAVVEAVLTGRRYTGPEALAAGIVQHTADESDVLPRAIELATRASSTARRVTGTHKEQLHRAALAVLDAEAI